MDTLRATVCVLAIIQGAEGSSVVLRHAAKDHSAYRCGGEAAARCVVAFVVVSFLRCCCCCSSLLLGRLVFVSTMEFQTDNPLQELVAAVNDELSSFTKIHYPGIEFPPARKVAQSTATHSLPALCLTHMTVLHTRTQTLDRTRT